MRGGRGRGVGKRGGCVKIGRGVVYYGIFLSGFVDRAYFPHPFLLSKIIFSDRFLSARVLLTGLWLD